MRQQTTYEINRDELVTLATEVAHVVVQALQQAQADAEPKGPASDPRYAKFYKFAEQDAELDRLRNFRERLRTALNRPLVRR